ncbi:hypothetical protein ACGTJS_03050 [Faucicola mancuniensis]|uniref:hypothetical protein n=1 Tax=Faucicola mancuniensis TaxID=1309795 RepID=UPI0039779E2B
MADFIFYQLLKTANAYDWFDEYELEDYRQIMLRQLESHQPYLTDERYELLKAIYQREFFESNMGD